MTTKRRAKVRDPANKKAEYMTAFEDNPASGGKQTSTGSYREELAAVVWSIDRLMSFRVRLAIACVQSTSTGHCRLENK